MGWNDRYDPSEYDPSDVDSMRALAMRSIRDSRTAPPAPKKDEVRGECWDCGHDTVIVRKGMCARCYMADNL